MHPDDLPAMIANWQAALAGGTTYQNEMRVRRADGTYRWHLARALPIRNDEGEIIRWIGTNTDIEDLKMAEASLARLNATLEEQITERTADRDRVWRNSQDIIGIFDQRGVIRQISPSVTRILGWTPETMTGRSLSTYLQNGESTDCRDGFVPCDSRYRCADGGFRWITWTSTREDGLVYSTGRDVTAEREAAEALAEAQEALRQSQKMEAVGQLTGGIAHDFNNMLAVVIGSLDLLGRRIGEGDARTRRYVDTAMEGARRAAFLTERLLAFSRQQPLQPQPIDPNKLVSGMSDLLTHSLGAAVRLETVLAAGMWRVSVDANQLENAILNLAVNARDAMPEGGRLTIETQNAYLDERYVEPHIGVPAGQYALIAVTDTGSGMPADVIAKAFDPFFTTKAVGKGTGLGLSQVYGFVKQSGGHVKIYSEAGNGTTVKIYLPRLVGPASDVEASTRPRATPRGDRAEVILVVDDEPAVRQLSVDALTELGYRVLEAEGGESALQMLDQHPEIVLLFTDVVMPGMNGRKLADEARRRRPSLKLLFTTGYTRNAVVHNGVLDPDVDLIGKPFTIDALAAKLRTVLDG